MDYPSYIDTEFLRPLMQAWMTKIQQAEQSYARKQWSEVTDECLMFYNRSCHAMWNPGFTRRVWHGVKAPRFRFTINKAFELVAIFGPNLMWSVPHRQVESKRDFELPPELLQVSPILQQMSQQLQPMQSATDAHNDVIAYLLQVALNYFPQEQPSGGLCEASKRAVTDSLLMGRGATVTRPYKFPGSERQLVGSFHVDPRTLFVDPDFNSFREARWLAIKHVQPYYEVEDRFQLPRGSLRGRTSMESTWAMSELATINDRGWSERAAGKTGDLIVWYEIYSKAGVGARQANMMSPMREHLEETVGQYAFICISPNVPYPLNCPTSNIRSGQTKEQIREHFKWPVPLWRDQRWPVEVLDYYDDPDGPYPIPPLAPGMGELKFLNFMMPWLANRIYTSSRDFWAIAGPHVKHYEAYLQNSQDQNIIPTPTLVEDVRKAITVLQQPETRLDAWRIVEAVSEMFDKRVGLTEFAYGRNESGTQDRTAETTMARARAVGVRPEHMQNMVIDWQSNIASLEAWHSHLFVRGADLAPRLGPLGVQLWDRFVATADIERISRQMTYTVAASSIRRPNRDRASQNFSAMLNTFAGILQSYSQQTGDFEPINELMRTFGELNDVEVGQFELQPPQPDPQQQAMQEQQMQMELQKMETELQKMLLEVQGKRIDAQAKQSDAQLGAQQQVLDMRMDQAKFGQDMQQDQMKHLLDMVQDHQKHRQEMRQSAQKQKLLLQQQRQKAAQKPSQNGRATSAA